MNPLEIMQAVLLAVEAGAKIGSAWSQALSDGPAGGLEPLKPLDFEADKALKEARDKMRAAADGIDKVLNS